MRIHLAFGYCIPHKRWVSWLGFRLLHPPQTVGVLAWQQTVGVLAWLSGLALAWLGNKRWVSWLGLQTVGVLAWLSWLGFGSGLAYWEWASGDCCPVDFYLEWANCDCCPVGRQPFWARMGAR